jgi:hypothetical protein
MEEVIGMLGGGKPRLGGLTGRTEERRCARGTSLACSGDSSSPASESG